MSQAIQQTGQSRIFYLDALRAFCMLYGVLLHGTSIGQGPDLLFQTISVSSDLFRMATFFVIAGFFTAMAYARKPWRDYVEGRAQVLLFPLISTMILLVPITNYLIHTWHNGPMSLTDYFLRGGWASRSVGNDVWHLHLWFLMSLVVYAALTPLLARVVTIPAIGRFLDWFAARPGGLLVFAMGFALVVVAMRSAHDLLFGPMLEGTRIDWLVLVTLYYLPYFALGLAMYHHRGLFRMMHRISVAGLVLFGGLLLGAVLLEDQLPRDAAKVLYWVGRGGLILMIIAALIRIFELYLNRPSRVLSFLVDSAFTFYLFHLTFIFVVAWAMHPLTDNVHVIFAVILVVVPAIVFALHAFVIARSPVLSLMFNGRARKRPVPAVS